MVCNAASLPIKWDFAYPDYVFADWLTRDIWWNQHSELNIVLSQAVFFCDKKPIARHELSFILFRITLNRHYRAEIGSILVVLVRFRLGRFSIIIRLQGLIPSANRNIYKCWKWHFIKIRSFLVTAHGPLYMMSDQIVFYNNNKLNHLWNEGRKTALFVRHDWWCNYLP